MSTPFTSNPTPTPSLTLPSLDSKSSLPLFHTRPLPVLSNVLFDQFKFKGGLEQTPSGQTTKVKLSEQTSPEKLRTTLTWGISWQLRWTQEGIFESKEKSGTYGLLFLGGRWIDRFIQQGQIKTGSIMSSDVLKEVMVEGSHTYSCLTLRCQNFYQKSVN